MRWCRVPRALWVSLVFAAACDGDQPRRGAPSIDGGGVNDGDEPDASSLDAGPDVATDAGADAGPDAGPDAGAAIPGMDAGSIECAPPMSEETCVLAEAMGLVNVRCSIDPVTFAFATPANDGGTGVHASPDDDCDDAPGLAAAIGRAAGKQTVYLPAPSGDAGVYRVRTPVNIGGATLKGEPGPDGTRVTPAPPFCGGGAAPAACPLPGATLSSSAACASCAILFAVDAGTSLSGITLDGTGVADYGLFITRAPTARLEDVEVRRALVAGMQIEDARKVSMRRLRAVANAGAGAILIGAEGLVAERLTATGNAASGVIVGSRGAARSFVHLLHAVLRSNGLDGLAVLGDVLGVTVEHADIAANMRDGVHLANTRSATIRMSRIESASAGAHPSIVGESANHAVSITDCKRCVVRDNVFVGDASARDIWVEGASPYADVRANMLWDPGMGVVRTIAGTPVQVKRVVGTRVSVTTQHHPPPVAMSAAPTTPQFGPGDIVWKQTPALSTPLGWVCQGTPCTWLKLSNLVVAP